MKSMSVPFPMGLDEPGHRRLALPRPRMTGELGYPGSMDYSQLHQAVDQLSPDQAKALLVVVTSMLGRRAEAESADVPGAVSEPARHRLSFTAAGNGPADLAEHTDDYLRAGAFGSSGT